MTLIPEPVFAAGIYLDSRLESKVLSNPGSHFLIDYI